MRERRIDLVGAVEGAPAAESSRPRSFGVVALHAAVAAASFVAVYRSVTDAGPARHSLAVAGVAVALGGWHYARWNRTPKPVSAQQFHVRTLDDRKVTCVVAGEAPTHRDVVRVAGTRTRDGRYAVRRLDVLASPAGPVVRRIATRSTWRRLADRLGWAAAGILTVWTLLAVTLVL